jgi:glc operon protein GlcG
MHRSLFAVDGGGAGRWTRGIMTPIASPDLAQQLVDEVARLIPEYLQEPIDREMSGNGNVAVIVITPDGRVVGRIFGNDATKGRWVFGIAARKVNQVRTTGYATGRFEELVYAKKLDDGPFGIMRPDFIGWEGGVALHGPDGKLFSAAFSGFRGEKDVEIVVRAAAQVPGLRVKQD